MEDWLIDSQFRYEAKNDKAGKRCFKARLCPHGKRDKKKGKIGCHSDTARLDVIRSSLSVSTMPNLRLGYMHIRGAYVQGGAIERVLYVHQPPQLGYHKDVLCHMQNVPYGICEAGRQWDETIQNWLPGKVGLEWTFGFWQLFSKRGPDRRISLLVDKVTDGLLIAGQEENRSTYALMLCGRFQVRKTIVDAENSSNDNTIVQDSAANV